MLGQFDGRATNDEVALGDIFDLFDDDYDSYDDDSYDTEDDEEEVGEGKTALISLNILKQTCIPKNSNFSFLENTLETFAKLNERT